MKNAIGDNQCGGCKHFHDPAGTNKVGACVRFPPTTFVVGMQPRSPLMDPSKGQEVQPIIRAYYPVVDSTSGCGEWRPVMDN